MQISRYRSIAALLLVMLAGGQALRADVPPSKDTPWLAMDRGPYFSASVESSLPERGMTPKGILIRVNKDKPAYVLFDADLLRYSCGWTGGSINFHNVMFDGSHQVWSKVVGDEVFGNGMMPGWAKGGSFDDPREKFASTDYLPQPVSWQHRGYGPLPHDWARYRGLYVHGERVVLSYTVGGVGVLDSPGWEASGEGGVFTRTLNIEPGEKEMVLQVAEHPLSGGGIYEGPKVLPRGGPADRTIAMIGEFPHEDAKGGNQTKLGALAVSSVGATNAMKWELTPHSQLRLHIPASKVAVKIKLMMTQISRPEEWATFGKAAQSSKPAEDLSGLTHGGGAKWTQEIETRGVLSSAAKPYVIDTLPMPVDNPWNSRMRLGGFDFFKGGHRAAVCTWDGDVWTVDGIDEKLGHLKWRRIAAGMFQPLGLKIVPDAQGKEQIYLCCRDQITRLHDLNGDGEIDFYESFNNDHQVTEHFHEFAMDLQTDAAGNFYYTKGGRHALPAVVPQHGTILKVSPDGKTTEIVCTGFRAPNGLGLGPDGQMVTSDQEGHWTPANRIDWVKPGGFYGYMWSFDGKSRKASDGFDPPLCWMPVKLDRSPAEELWVTSDKWGPLKGKMIHTSYGTGKMFLVMYETINGIPQGGVVPFADINFNTGTMRGRFNAEDGQLYVCGLVGWASNLTVPGGFFRVRYTGRKVYSPVDLRVKQNAIVLTFSEPLDKTSAQDVQNYAVQQWQYRWAEKYGSAHYRVSDPSKEGQDEVTVAGADLSADGKTVVLKIPGLKPVMQMQIEMNVDAADGTPVHAVVHNTINAIGQ